MKFKTERAYAGVDAAEKKLLELANAMEADHAGRLHVGPINRQFLEAGGSVAEYTAAVRAAIDRGYIGLHPSGAYITFTRACSPDGSDGLETTIRRSDPAAPRPPAPYP
jgi:hypothetical protein